MDTLTAALIANEVPPDLAQSLTNTVADAMDAAAEIESAAFTIYNNLKNADFTGMQSLVNVDLTSGIATASGNGTPVNIGDKINVIATSYDDRITGTGAANTIDAGRGNDFVEGGGGADALIGGAGNDQLFGGAGSDVLSGDAGNDQLDGGASGDKLFGGEGTDSYTADNGDTVTDSDGLGTVTFTGIVLRGGEKEADDQNDDCFDEDDAPKNNADSDDKYIGESGEEYVRSGGGLTVTSGGSTLTITGWSDGDLGIELKDDDPEEWSPPDCYASPLVLDLDGDGIEIIRLRNSQAFFDIDNDGAAENTAWVSADDGILSLDLNGNGRIDGVSELFGYGETWAGGGGNPSGLSGPGALNQRYTSGFEALAEYDFNADGVINATDTFYTALKVWRDLNGNGTSEQGELFGLAELGVQSISLTALAGTREIADSLITDTGSFVRADGTSGEVSDVWFRFDQFDVRFDDSRVTDAIAALPQLRASGGLPDLHTAMADDPVLLQMVLALGQLGGADLAAFRVGVQEMMFRWAGVSDINPFSRGNHVDGRELAFLEVVSDTAFMQQGSANPRTFAGQKLSVQFETILRDTMVRLAAQTAIGDAVIPEVSFNNGAFIDLATGTSSTPLLDSIFSTAPAGWAAAFAHLQAGLTMLDRVYMSFADVAGAADNGAGYRAGVEARLTAAGFAGISYDVVIAANVGSDGDDSILTTSIRGLVFELPTDVTITGAGDDEVRWGNKEEILLWGAGQGNDEIMADSFFSERQSTSISSVIRMQELLLSEVTISKGQGLLSNDLAITITATGEVLTIRDGLLAENLARVGLLFADGSLVPLISFEPVISALAQTGSADDNILFQRTGLVLDGGAGNDVLRGQQGATTYVFGRGYGVDEVFEDIDQRGSNTVQFGADISFGDLEIIRPEFGNPGDLYLRIAGTTDELRIYRQFDNTTFIVDRFVFADGTEFTAEDFLAETLRNDAGDQRVVGSGREEYLFGGTGNDTLSGLRGDDTYSWGAGSGSDIIRDAGLGKYDPSRSISFYREFFVDRGWGDRVDIGYAFNEFTASRAGTILTFVHDATGERLVIDNTSASVERITFAGNPYVYSLPEVMALIDANVDETGGSQNDDLLTGTSGGDLVAAGDGDDTVLGLGGPDTLSGEAGDDLLDGGDRGDDNANTPTDGNTLFGGVGDDTLLGGFEVDQLFGGAGNDRLEASFEADLMNGGAGNDTLLANYGGSLVYNSGDGDDLLLSADNRFAQTTLEFGAGIAASDVTWSIRNVPIAGLTSYYEFANETTAYALVGTLLGGGSVTLVGSFFADNMAGLDSVRFTQTGQTVTTASILAGLFAPSDADQIIVGTRINDSFAPGGGNDLIVSGGGSDTLSFGLNDGNDTVEGTIARVLLEGGVLPATTIIERLGDRFEDLRVTLADGSTVLIPDILSIRQNNDGDTLV
ncbi:MAG: calcium-binding protein, partial [Paracoccaceae bacterium]